MDVSGKVAVVTGGASGIGFALAERFLNDGMRVVIADVEEPALAEAAAKLQGGGEVVAVPTDVALAESVEALARRTLDAFGRVHVVCNNAGVGGRGGPVWELPRPAWEWTLGVNFWGVLHGIRTFVPHLVPQDEGHVVNTASLAGITTGPALAPYTVSKHAVVALSEVLYHDLVLAGSKVRASVLCPGFVRTRIMESERNYNERYGSLPPEEQSPLAAQVRSTMESLVAAATPPADVAAVVAQAIVEERFWILPHLAEAEAEAEAARARVKGMLAATNPPPWQRRVDRRSEQLSGVAGVVRMDAVVETLHGNCGGSVADGVCAFFGRPYAAPPFGANRLRPPRPVELWSGVRDATKLGPEPPQVAPGGGVIEFARDRVLGGELPEPQSLDSRPGDWRAAGHGVDSGGHVRAQLAGILRR